MRHWIWAGRVALAVCLILTAWGAFAPPGEGPHLFQWDKADHFSAFFALTASAIVAFPRSRLVVIAVTLSAGAAAIEVIQALPLIHRDADVKDWLADAAAVGAVIGVVVASRIRTQAQEQEQTS